MIINMYVKGYIDIYCSDVNVCIDKKDVRGGLK